MKFSTHLFSQGAYLPSLLLVLLWSNQSHLCCRFSSCNLFQSKIAVGSLGLHVRVASCSSPLILSPASSPAKPQKPGTSKVASGSILQPPSPNLHKWLKGSFIGQINQVALQVKPLFTPLGCPTGMIHIWIPHLFWCGGWGLGPLEQHMRSASFTKD